MGTIQTLKVARLSDGSSIVINACDFDKEKHKRVRERLTLPPEGSEVTETDDASTPASGPSSVPPEANEKP